MSRRKPARASAGSPHHRLSTPPSAIVSACLCFGLTAFFTSFTSGSGRSSRIFYWSATKSVTAPASRTPGVRSNRCRGEIVALSFSRALLCTRVVVFVCVYVCVCVPACMCRCAWRGVLCCALAWCGMCEVLRQRPTEPGDNGALVSCAGTRSSA